MFFEVIIIIIAFGILGDVIKIQPLLNYDFICSPINLDNLSLMQFYVYVRVGQKNFSPKEKIGYIAFAKRNKVY